MKDLLLQGMAKQFGLDPNHPNLEGAMTNMCELKETKRYVNWIAKSSNVKVGPVPVSYASVFHYCSDTCAFKDNGCYAQGGNVRIHEQGVTKGKYSRSLMDILPSVTRYAKIARHRVSGDVFNPLGLNDVEATYDECVVLESAGLINIGYTHSWKYDEVQPLKTYFRASCDSYDDIEQAVEMGWSTELTVVEFNDSVVEKIAKIGEKLGIELVGVGCPAQKTGNKIDCNTCTLCKVNEKTQKYVIVFYTHGGLMKKANKVLEKLQGK